MKIDFLAKMAYMCDMRILSSVSFVLLFSAMAAPSIACDRHGGMFGQLNGSSWTEYDPATAESDALLLEEQMTKWRTQKAAKSEIAKPAKPSFSKVSSRASMAAQVRLAQKAKLAKQNLVDPSVTIAEAKNTSE